jgi:hypothetical protein
MSFAAEALDKKRDEVAILVLGDVNIDTLIVPRPHEAPASEDGRMAWQEEGNCWLHRRRGGAWLITEIINAALAAPSFVEACGVTIAKTYGIDENNVGDSVIETSLAEDYLSSLAILGLFRRGAKSPLDDKRQAYRVERFLGWVHTKARINAGSGALDPYQQALLRCLDLLAREEKRERDILVLHDKAGYFRHLPAPLLECAIGRQFTEGKTWIVWQMYSPLAEGILWQTIQKRKDWLDRTIVVVKMECLRQAGVNLPRNTSLEQESRLFVEGMKQVDRVKDLAGVRHIVVHQHREGVLHYDRELGLKNSCYYCPHVSDDPASHERGIMVGYTSVLVAAIVRGMVWSHVARRERPTLNIKHPEDGIIAGMKQGAVLDHLLYLIGFGDKDIFLRDARPTPYDELFKSLAKLREAQPQWERDGTRYHVAGLELPGDGDLANWSRIEGFIKRGMDSGQEDQQKLSEENAEKIACDVVRRGLQQVVEADGKDEQDEAPGKSPPDTPPHTVRCPYEVHGKIKTAYHAEIDSFASIRRIMEKYLDDDGWKSPLSIAVFGPPGSGKSFTIRQILGTVDPDIVKRPLEFNIAQFNDLKDLETAFHKVQDAAVAGEVPLVFFDEFDAQNLKWLKYFLAPMQDGTFKAGEGTYRIGRAAFVFAGGVSNKWSEFYDARKPDQDTWEQFKAKKGPDFVSRLRGHLDIATINCPGGTGSLRSGVGMTRVSSVLMFRRAILLRSLLEEHLPSIFDKNSKEARIDPDVVRAFLQVREYEHEARSMQAIIEMSRLSPRGIFQKSSLPASDQLKMHVDEKEFRELMNPPSPLIDVFS